MIFLAEIGFDTADNEHPNVWITALSEAPLAAARGARRTRAAHVHHVEAREEVPSAPEPREDVLEVHAELPHERRVGHVRLARVFDLYGRRRSGFPIPEKIAVLAY